MSFLADVPQIEDPRLAHPEADPGGTLTVAITDDTVELHDRVCFVHAESLDDWDVVAYQHSGRVTWIARSRNDIADRARVATLTAGEYSEVADQVARYWNSQRGG
jgi:hypothetical protein